MLTIDRAYFALTGGLERWLYRLVRKHAGKQPAGWRFDFRHLHAKLASLSPFKRFAFELRDLVRRQSLPGYRFGIESAGTRELLVFAQAHLSTAGCGQDVEVLVPSGTNGHVLSGTRDACDREPESPFFFDNSARCEPPNLESNPSDVGAADDAAARAHRHRIAANGCTGDDQDSHDVCRSSHLVGAAASEPKHSAGKESA